MVWNLGVALQILSLLIPSATLRICRASLYGSSKYTACLFAGRTGHHKLVTRGSWLLSKQCKLPFFFLSFFFFFVRLVFPVTPSWADFTMFGFVVNLWRYSSEMGQTLHQRVLCNVFFFYVGYFHYIPLKEAWCTTQNTCICFQDNKITTYKKVASIYYIGRSQHTDWKHTFRRRKQNAKYI